MKSSLLAEYGFCDDVRPDSAGGPQAPGAPDALPCQNSHSSIGSPFELSSSQRKSAFALKENIAKMVERYGIEHLGFLTLTFDPKAKLTRDRKRVGRKGDLPDFTNRAAAQSFFNSLCTNIIKGRYPEYVTVPERHKSGRIHYHLLVACSWNVKRSADGFRFVDFTALRERDYSSVNARLKQEWAFWRETAPTYMFGRCEMLPIKSTKEAISCYLAKYVAKNLEHRKEEDKGAKLVRYSRKLERNADGSALVDADTGKKVWKGTNVVKVNSFAFNSTGYYLWRQKLGLLVLACGVKCSSKFKEWFGPRWAYLLRPIIDSVRLPVYRDGRAFNRDYPEDLRVPDDAQDVYCSDDDFCRLRAAVLVLWRERFKTWTPQGGPKGEWAQYGRFSGPGSAGI